VSRIILRTNTDYFHKINKLGLDRIRQHPSSICKYCQTVGTVLHKILFSFQLATGELERAVYKNLIAPYKNDMPPTYMVGLIRACADHKYAFFCPNILITRYSMPLPCQLVPIPGTSYRNPAAFMISKNSSYKGLINWR
jgi:hypothetical protein